MQRDETRHDPGSRHRLGFIQHDSKDYMVGNNFSAEYLSILRRLQTHDTRNKKKRQTLTALKEDVGPPRTSRALADRNTPAPPPQKNTPAALCITSLKAPSRTPHCCCAMCDIIENTHKNQQKAHFFRMCTVHKVVTRALRF